MNPHSRAAEIVARLHALTSTGIAYDADAAEIVADALKSERKAALLDAEDCLTQATPNGAIYVPTDVAARKIRQLAQGVTRG